MILAKKIFFCFLLLICSVACPNFAQAETGSIDLSTPMLHQNKKGSICLTMIVRNEARIIERCLNSVKDIADCISICDTGSTDNTVEIIEQFMKKHHIPGTVHHHVWKNFGHNRTLSIQAAQKTLNSLGFPLQHTFLLLLDADMKLEIEPEFTKNALTFDCYLVLQRSSALSYYNTRLVRASLPWESVGVTHEYLSSKFPHQRQQLNTLIIDDQEDGGCKSDKFERDIRLLTQGLKDEPENERYMFYFAQSHKCLSQFDDAIKWYQHRIAKGGWKEEVWYSMYMIGECYEALEQWDDALHWYLEAYQYNPERSETLHKIARHYRIQGQNELSYLFAKQGERVPYPKNQILFIAHPVYDYLFDEELSIASCFSGKSFSSQKKRS